MANVFLNSSRAQPGPWSTETVPHPKRPRESRIYIIDAVGEPVCEISRADNRHTAQHTRYSRDLIQHAPQLLAALTEFVYNAEVHGIHIRPELGELIHSAGGPDLREHIGKHNAGRT